MRGDTEISGDYIDSRDVEARIDYLESDRDDYQTECNACDGAGNAPDDAASEPTSAVCPECDGSGKRDDPSAWTEEYPDDAEELAALVALRDDCGARDWHHGVTLIADSAFKDYARDLHEDINGQGATEWPYDCIDWDQAADALQSDYNSVEFRGDTYWYRD
jgi:hypothetical protein